MNIAAAPDPRIAYFDQLAPRWDTQCSNPAAVLQRLASLRARLPLRPGLHLLEVGCGTGQITGWLAAQVAPGQVVAVDFSPAMLEIARARGIPGAVFCQADICQGPPPGGPFDAALCFNAFPHFRDQDAALRHLAAALQPGGVLLVLHLCGSEALNQFHHQLNPPVNHDHLPPLDCWPVMLRDAGLAYEEGVDQADLFLLRARKL
ncbi:class I SAM-dependent methyltransferase [Fontisphaera persica]|uniref:class I SAM-dependent DNA methyltransferase n=1 Tax=Fontisphaera persica TaxID=2974023 RepID=UPI0024BFED98|nr:class I SAM-dependent methyltransferase [Fontisphaera persica]WCJ58963.1 class I SAM-dependent methyltransferase [Fontisphaera persica]